MAKHVSAETPDRGITDPAKRKWLYGIAVAALALAGAYRLVDQEVLPLWAELVANVLGVSGGALALVNTPARAS